MGMLNQIKPFFRQWQVSLPKPFKTGWEKPREVSEIHSISRGASYSRCMALTNQFRKTSTSKNPITIVCSKRSNWAKHFKHSDFKTDVQNQILTRKCEQGLLEPPQILSKLRTNSSRRWIPALGTEFESDGIEIRLQWRRIPIEQPPLVTRGLRPSCNL